MKTPLLKRVQSENKTEFSTTVLFQIKQKRLHSPLNKQDGTSVSVLLCVGEIKDKLSHLIQKHYLIYFSPVCLDICV